MRRLRAVGDFQDGVAGSRPDHGFLKEVFMSQTNHEQFDYFGRRLFQFEAQVMFPQTRVGSAIAAATSAALKIILPGISCSFVALPPIPPEPDQWKPRADYDTGRRVWRPIFRKSV